MGSSHYLMLYLGCMATAVIGLYEAPEMGECWGNARQEPEDFISTTGARTFASKGSAAERKSTPIVSMDDLDLTTIGLEAALLTLLQE